MRSHETPRTESDKHWDVIKENVCASTAVAIPKSEKLSEIAQLASKTDRNGNHQTLLLG